jgi:hypothetical protein
MENRLDAAQSTSVRGDVGAAQERSMRKTAEAETAAQNNAARVGIGFGRPGVDQSLASLRAERLLCSIKSSSPQKLQPRVGNWHNFAPEADDFWVVRSQPSGLNMGRLRALAHATSADIGVFSTKVATMLCLHTERSDFSNCHGALSSAALVSSSSSSPCRWLADEPISAFVYFRHRFWLTGFLRVYWTEIGCAWPHRRRGLT